MLKRILLLIFIAFIFASNQVEAKDITIVHFSDTHIDTISMDKKTRKLAQSVPMFERAVQKTNQLKPDIVVFSGDMVNKPIATEFDVFLKIAKKLNIPFYIALGNHDVGVFGGMSKEVILSKYNLIRGFDISKHCYSVIKDDYIFIFMDGTTDKIISANGFFSKESLEFLDTTLTQNSDKKAIIVQHFPLVPPFESLTHEIIGKEEYFKVLDKHTNVIMVLAGHYHAYSEIIRNNVLHITTSSLVQMPHAFREIKVFDEENGFVIESILHTDMVQNPRYKLIKSRKVITK